jgi:hypothetical protein
VKIGEESEKQGALCYGSARRLDHRDFSVGRALAMARSRALKFNHQSRRRFHRNSRSNTSVQFALWFSTKRAYSFRFQLLYVL